MPKESQQHNDKGRAKTSLEKNIPFTLFGTFECERELETEQNCNILTPLSWPSALCLYRSPDAPPEGRGPTLLAFSTASYHQLVSKTPSGVPRAPSAGCGFPYHILSPTSLIPNCLTSRLD